MTIESNLPPTAAMPPGTGFADATAGNQPAFFSGKSVQVTAGKASAAGGVDPAVEGDLRRDDALGRMFAGAFNLPPPAIPVGLNG